MARNQIMPMNQYAMGPQTYSVSQPKQGLGTRIKQGLFGVPGQLQQLPTQSPQQQQLQNLSIQNLMQMLSGGAGAPQRFDFAPIAQQARNQFETQTIPSLAERFTALGGGQNSSAFQGALGRAGSDLEGNLASMGAQFGQNQQQLDQSYLLNLLRFAFQPQFETQYKPATGGLFGSAASGVGQGLGNFGGTVGGLSALKYLGFL